MKKLIFAFLMLSVLSCSTENPDDGTQQEKEETAQTLCETNDISCNIEAGGITMNATKSWLIYNEGVGSVYSVVLKWEYPGAPEWNGANSLSFEYDENTTLASGMEYEAKNLIGIIEFDGQDGQMFGSIKV